MSGLQASGAGVFEIYGGTNMNNEKRRNVEGGIFLILFCLTIPAANWLIGHVGTVCVPNGLCLVPVAPGIMAPSGVLMIGAALVLRDLVQRRLGVEFGIAAIIAGAAISAGLASRSLVVASAVAFLLSEFVDFAIYTPLARQRLVIAVVASSIAGLMIDSIMFLWLAFGSLDFLLGQIIGKAWMVLLSIPLVAYLRRRDQRLGLTVA
jgi:queuosine precursor transporter